MEFPQDGSGSLPAILVGFVNFCYLAGMYTTHQNQQTASQFGRPGAIEWKWPGHPAPVQVLLEHLDMSTSYPRAYRRGVLQMA